MKRFLVICIIIGVAILVVGGAYCLQKCNVRIEPQSVKVAVIDSTLIKTKSLPFIKIRELLDAEHARIHEEVLAQEIKLRNEYDQIKNSGASATQKQQQKLEFDKKVSALEQEIQKIKEKIGKQFGMLTNNVEANLNAVIAEIVKQYGFNIVLNMTIHETRAVLYADKALDITPEVIRRLDKMLPDLTLPQIE